MSERWFCSFFDWLGMWLHSLFFLFFFSASGSIMQCIWENRFCGFIGLSCRGNCNVIRYLNCSLDTNNAVSLNNPFYSELLLLTCSYLHATIIACLLACATTIIHASIFNLKPIKFAIAIFDLLQHQLV
jgi:hypothetical protein